MNNQEMTEFREMLYYGMDNIIFNIAGTMFQINSGWENNAHSITVYKISIIFEGNEPNENFDEVFSSNAHSAEENIKKFFDEPLFDGKTFWEVEQVIEWVDE